MATPATKHTGNLPTVALVGRTNVGKSTLFNRLIEEQKAIVSEIPGTTRTNNEGIVLWRGKEIRVIDTGGVTFQNDVPFEEEIMAQSAQAIAKADLVVMILDGRVGVMPQDRALGKLLRFKGKPVVIAANKVDHDVIEQGLHSSEWFQLGFGEPFPVSAASGRNVGNFLDLVYERLGKGRRRPKVTKPEAEIIHVSLIGKPNVGKSSLFNKLIGEDKVIVSDIPHTTREPHDTLMAYKHEVGKKARTALFNFIDTAGIRRKSQVAGELEKFGIQKSLAAIDRSDIILFVIDGKEPISSQDMQLGGLLEKRSKSVIILLNKWDLAEDVDDRMRNEVKKGVYSHFPHLHFAPILFVSGKTGLRVHQIFPTLIDAWNARQTEISSDKLQDFMRSILREHKPARGKGTRQPELLGFRQIKTNPPIFELFIKVKTSLHMSYVHFIENKLREKFNFFAVPIVIKLTKMKK